ncbi:MAG: SRPBCC family protein [Sandaracinaceae bacterium]
MTCRSRPIARPLRWALLFNAVFSTFCALALAAFADRLRPHLGDVPTVALQALAAGLAVFVALLVWQAICDPPRLLWALLTIVADALWVLGSAVLLSLVGDRLSGLGVALVVTVAAVVAVSAALQWRGLQRVIRRPDPRLGTAHRYEVDVEVDVARERLWPVVADLGSIRDHGRSLTESFVEGGARPGLGAVRRCVNDQGRRWAEEVTGWRPEHGMEMRFLSDEASFPFPMDPMHGGWVLEALGPERTRVTVWWAFTTKPAWAAPVIVPLMDAGLRRDMAATVRSMAARARAPGAGPVAQPPSGRSASGPRKASSTP